MELGGKSPIVIFEDVDLDKGQYLSEHNLHIMDFSFSSLIKNLPYEKGATLEFVHWSYHIPDFDSIVCFSFSMIYSCRMDDLWLLLDKWSDLQCHISSTCTRMYNNLDDFLSMQLIIFIYIINDLSPSLLC